MKSAEGLKIRAHDAMMTRTGPWTFSVAAVVLVGLIVGTCLTGLAEASSATDRVCAAVKGEELSSSKTPPLTLLEVPLAHSAVPRELPLGGALPVDLTPDFISAIFYEDLSSRSPPALL